MKTLDFKRFIAVLMLLFIGAQFLVPTVIAAASKRRVVRVGFYPMKGFHEYTGEGEPTGYDVALLNEVLHYKDWDIQYVRADNWEQAVVMLENGEIDLLGAVQRAAEREEQFDFCMYDAGYTYRAIVALPSSDLTYHDFAGIGEARIGCVKSDVRVDALKVWLERAEISPTIVYYDTFTQMESALNAGEISLMACDMMEMSGEHKLVAKYAPSPFYYAVQKGEVELLEELNEAFARVMLNKPWAIDELTQKYFRHSYIMPLSAEDLEFAAQSEPIKVGMFSRLQPYSWVKEDGSIAGIYPEMLKMISDMTGFRFELVPIKAGDSPVQTLKQGDFDLAVGVVDYKTNQEDKDILLSDPFLVGQTSVFAKSGTAFAAGLPLTIATTNGYGYTEHIISEKYESFKLKKYDTVVECLDAQKRGEVDAVMQNNFVIEAVIRTPHYDGIEVVPTAGGEERLCMATSSSSDPTLMSIMNKAIGLISENTMNQTVINYTISHSYKLSLKDFWIRYQREVSATVIFLCALTLAGIYVIILKRKNMNIIKENEVRLSNITNNINGGVITLIPNKGFTITYANRGFMDLIGYTKDEFDGIKAHDGITYVHPDDTIGLQSVVDENRHGEQIEMELRVKHRLKGYIPTLFRGTFAQTGTPLLYCVVVDISMQKHMQEEIEIEKERYRLLIEKTDDMIFELDEETMTVVSTAKYKEKFGYNLADRVSARAQSMQLIMHPSDHGEITRIKGEFSEGKRTASCRVRIIKLTGEYCWCDIHCNVVSAKGRPIRIVGKITDVDTQVKERERLTKLSERDVLTGLYNKTAFMGVLDEYLANNMDTNRQSAIMFFDIDNFKMVNDELGHLVGDEAIVSVSHTLKGLFRKGDTLGRFGGDEFFVFLQDIPTDKLMIMANCACQSLRMEYGTTNVIAISSSIGICCFTGEDGLTSKELLRRADEALYAAKAGGKDQFVLYEEGVTNSREG